MSAGQYKVLYIAEIFDWLIFYSLSVFLPQHGGFLLHWLHHTDMLLPRMLSCIMEIGTSLASLTALVEGRKVSKASVYLLHMS